MSGRHAKGDLGWLPILAVSFFAAFIILAISGAFPLKITGSDGSDPSPGNNAAANTPRGASPTTSADPSGCKDLWAHELRVALAAERTLQEWRLHIETMDQLVAGKITQAQADMLWDATRRGDLHRIRQFHRLDTHLQNSPTTCDAAAAAEADTACAAAAHAVEQTIDAARTAVQTWRVHIRDMRMRRAGEITSAEAMQRWTRLWQTGQVQTVRYDHRASVALGHHCA
jgi:hypothetical protein